MMSRSENTASPAPPATATSAVGQLAQSAQRLSKRKRRTSSSALTPAATSVATSSPGALSSTSSPQPGNAPDAVATVQPPPSLKASRPLPTQAPPPKRLRHIPTIPEPWVPFDIVERMFARFAASRNGITIGGKVVHTFAEAADPKLPLWSPQLFADFITYYAANARSRRPGAARVDSKALYRFQQTVRRCYSRRHGKALSKDAANAATEARHAADKLTGPRGPRPVLTMAEVFRLAKAVWSPAYRATFRRRLDVALFMSLVLATGVPSSFIFPHAVPGKGYDDGPVYALSDASDGARWSDFEVWMTRYGPAAQLTSRADGGRRYTLNDGNTLGMAASRLMAITMCFDELCGAGIHLGYLLSNVFWAVDGHDARIVAFDQEHADKHIFRLDDERQTPMMKEDMNFELARLAKAAGIDHEVTTGMFRRLVAHKVFEQHGLEIASAILNHDNLMKTQRYLEKKLGRTITAAERELGRGMDTLHKDLWLTLDHKLRVKTIQKIPDYITPHAWDSENDRSPTPPLHGIGEPSQAQRTDSLAQRSVTPTTPTPFAGQPGHCLVATPSDPTSFPASPAGPTGLPAVYRGDQMSPLDGSALFDAQGALSQPKVAVHHHQLFGQPTSATQGGQYSQQGFGVGGQMGVSAHVAMYGHFPKISDIRGFGPSVPAMPVVAEPGSSQPAVAQDPQQIKYAHGPQDMQWSAQQGRPEYQHRSNIYNRIMQQQPADAVSSTDNRARSHPGLLTPDYTPPESLHQSLPTGLLPDLQAVAPQMQRVRSAPTAYADMPRNEDSSIAAINAGLGLFFEPNVGAQPTQPGPATGKQQAPEQAGAHLHSQFRAQRPEHTLPAMKPRRQPPSVTTHAPQDNMTYEERVLGVVARWMASPAQSLRDGVNLVYTMMECDKRLPRNEAYDPSAYDEEDVDTDEE